MRALRRAAVAATLLLSAVAPATSWAATSQGSWRPSAVPQLSGGSLLNATVAFGRTNVWAFGGEELTDRGGRPVAVRWDGRAWHRNTVPGSGVLSDASGSSPSDIWALAAFGARAVGGSNLVHFDGGRWTAVAGPKINGRWKYTQVKSFGPRDVWVTGTVDGAKPDQWKAFLYRFDGRKWTEVRLPAKDGAIQPTAIEGTSSRNLWLVGAHGDLHGSPGYGFTFHWNGSQLRDLPFPRTKDVAPTDLTFHGGKPVLVGFQLFVDGQLTTASSLPAVGNPTSLRRGLRGVPVVFGWNGRTWAQQKQPVTEGAFYSVSGDGRGGLVAVGQHVGGDGSPIFARFDGRQWRNDTVDAGLAKAAFGMFSTAWVPGTAEVVAVGYSGDAAEAKPAVARRG